MDRPWHLQNTGWLQRMTDEDMMLFMRICPECRGDYLLDVAGLEAGLEA